MNAPQPITLPELLRRSDELIGQQKWPEARYLLQKGLQAAQ